MCEASGHAASRLYTFNRFGGYDFAPLCLALVYGSSSGEGVLKVEGSVLREFSLWFMG